MKSLYGLITKVIDFNEPRFLINNELIDKILKKNPRPSIIVHTITLSMYSSGRIYYSK